MKRRYKPIAPVDGIKLVREFATRDLSPPEPNAWELEEQRLRAKRDAMMAEVFAAPRAVESAPTPAFGFQPGDVVVHTKVADRTVLTVVGRQEWPWYVLRNNAGFDVSCPEENLRLIRPAAGFKVGDRVVLPWGANPTHVYTVHRIQDEGLVILKDVVAYWAPHELELAP